MKKNNHIKLGEKHIWLPYCQMQNHLPQLEVKDAKDCKIFLKNGDILIDGISSWWSAAHGYQHKHIISAITNQAKKLSHIMLAGFANDETYKLAHRLCKFSKMDHVFFSDSGSTAVEVAMKMSWQFYINSGEKTKTKFVSFKNSYHGDTSGAMSLADLSSGMHKKFEKLLLKNISLDLPQDEKSLKKFDDFLQKNKKEIAGIFVEPLVQCAGGMKFHSPKILKEIFKISKKHDIIFIADECAVGFYRTGAKFAFEKAKIKPDILILGKALTGGSITLAATLTSKKIFDKFLGTCLKSRCDELDNATFENRSADVFRDTSSSKSAESGVRQPVADRDFKQVPRSSLDLALMHGPTFMGNALACAAANASLDLFEKEDYAKKVKKIEKILETELQKCKNLKKVKEVRVLGAIGAVEIVVKDFKEILDLRKAFIKKGVFLRPFADVVYIMPPLTIKESELKKITNAVFAVLSK